MKKILYAAAFFAAAAGGFAQGLQSKCEGLLGTLMDLTTENMAMQNVAPDAFIGKFLPSIPPHFSAGITASSVIADSSWYLDAANALIDEFNGKLSEAGQTEKLSHFPSAGEQPLPSCSVNARIGGFFLPFDVGLFGMIASLGPQMTGALIRQDDSSLDVQYLAFGADFRYALYEGSLLLPKVSLGAGYAFAEQQMRYSGGARNLESEVSLYARQHTLSAQVQVSKKILILTPFIGAKALVTFGESSMGYKMPSANIEKYYSYDRKNSISNVTPHLFTGLGVTLLLVQLDVSGAYNPALKTWSASVSARFKM